MSAIGSNRSKSRAVRAPRPIACSKKLMSVLSATLGADRYSKVPSAAAAFRSTRRTSHRRYGLTISRCRSRSWKANSGAGTRRTTGCRNEPSGTVHSRPSSERHAMWSIKNVDVSRLHLRCSPPSCRRACRIHRSGAECG
jgi:hypothetical protein